jgi:hypothetical protein
VVAVVTLVRRGSVAVADLAARQAIRVRESADIQAKLALVDSRDIRVRRDIRDYQDTLVRRVSQESAVILE